MTTVHCQRCQEEKGALPKAPFKNDLGQRLLSHICHDCWKEWLVHQTLLINHNGLDPRNAEARAFLYGEIERVLLGDGDAEQVDTTKRGDIDWGSGPS